MKTLREKIAWFRAEQYLARYKPYGIVVAGTYGREYVSHAIWNALRRRRHVRTGGSIEHTIDIPEGILGAKGHREHQGLMRLLVRSKLREVTQFEPDTVITQLPLVVTPHTAPWALERILPRMLVLTHMGLEHLDLFVNKGMIAHEYLRMANTLQRDAVVVMNIDDDALRAIGKDIDRPVITYGAHPTADVRVVRSVPAEKGKGLILEIALHRKRHELYLPHLFAQQHVSAVAAGIAAAHGLGISVEDATGSMRTMKPRRGFLSHAKGIHGSIVIDDSYSTCPEQLSSSLQTLDVLPCFGRKISVLGDMDHLAALAKENHAKVGVQVASIAPIAVFVGSMMRHAQDAALQSGNAIDTHHFTSSSEAATWLAENVRENDMIFVSGGKSMSMGDVVKKLKEKEMDSDTEKS